MPALAGVAASLVLHVRETKVNREHNSRQVHNQLMRMALDDPAWLECWGPYVGTDDPVGECQYSYVNLILSYWQGRYELGTFTDEHLRSGAREMFGSPPGPRFWADARDERATAYRTRRERRFHSIVDEEYRRAIERTPSPTRKLACHPNGRAARWRHCVPARWPSARWGSAWRPAGCCDDDVSGTAGRGRR